MNGIVPGPHEAALLQEDERARAAALDVRRSFLVQAPAGSGKTELLIQRCLALLGHVDEPERIIALTFTRKAAGEMRDRVLAALRGAEADDDVQPHERVTRDLARAALAQDRARGWSLREHPARLRIQTFDSLTTWLVRSAPFAASLGPRAGYTDDAAGLYAEAAAAAIARASPDDPHWRRLLVHLHNDADQVARLLARLLARRDQLLRQVGVGDAHAVRRALATALDDEVASALAALQRAFPADLGDEIARLARHASRSLQGDDALAAALSACADCGGLPPFDASGLPHWRTLSGWLLTRNGVPRASINAKQGFPPAGRDPGKSDRAAAKQSMEALVARIAAVPGLAETLHGVATMPAPAALGDAAWEVVEALLHVVPRAAAQLSTTFAKHREVDFVQAGIAALGALGEPDAPSDLLQRIDYRLMHLLVDEFQDTSATQVELLARLTAGWTPGEDGRTIFAVGDPMQSIYRFREAEVRLFVEAQLRGDIAGVPVECLTLRRNFRSRKGIVDWVNRTFPEVLGRVSDPTRGAVAFAEATATKDAAPGDAVTLDLVADAAEEARTVVARVRDALASGARDVAVLVRARAHLDAILPALRDAGIDFAAVELDRLGQRQAVQDLLSLTHALLQPGDRLAWLAVLRAPWCGLALADLLAVADAVPPPHPIAAVLDDPALPAALSEDGRARFARVAPVLRAAQGSHGRGSVVARVRGAWLALGGPACLADPLDLETAERFFEVLATHEHAGDVPDWCVLVAELDELTAAPEPNAGTRVQVMTMHKAKGLQFDVVVLPGLGRKGRGASHELMRWRSRERGLLVAPSKSPGGEDDPVYAYLTRLEREESSAELGRLLYVASTRARERLHLVGAPAAKADAEGNVEWRPPSSSSLAKLWPAIERDAPPATLPCDSDERAVPPPPLVRLPTGYDAPRADDGLAPAPVVPRGPRDDVPFDWAQERAKAIGTLAHRLLARMADEFPWDGVRVDSWLPRVRADLASAGFGGDEVDSAADRVLDVVRRTLADERGRWLFAPEHEDAHSEWALAGVEGDAVVHLALDRTFVADGVRWIVDFKTGSHEGGDVTAFLARERERYRPQLARYARIVRALEPSRPVRVALYYPLVPQGFLDWDPGDAAAT